tara:strand:- start:75 stop:959 length:885 start_codon:yes stop_codon:yes gene_type:complete
MTKARWQEQTLQKYYPDYLSKKNFKLILKRFSSWHKRALKEERFSDALSRVKNLKSSNDMEDLIHHLLVVCFLAKHGNKFDDSKKIRNDWKDLGKNVETQKKLIRKLTRILKKCSERQAGYSILVPKGKLNSSTRKLLAPLDPKVANYLWSPDFIENILNAYSVYLEGAFGKHSINADDLLPFNMKLGALLYPKKPSRQAHRLNLQENSLIYNLAFLFRHFTKRRRGHWLPSTEGTIIKSGKSNYGLISELANATFYPTGQEVDEEQELNPSKVRDRMLSLTKANVKLGCWFGM